MADFDFVTLVGQHESALNWTVLLANARVLHPPVIELAFVFILIGMNVANMPLHLLGSGAAAIAILLVLAGRGLSIYPLSALFSRSPWRLSAVVSKSSVKIAWRATAAWRSSPRKRATRARA